MDLKMILLDGTELSIDAFGLPCHAVMTCESKEAMMAIWQQLTAMNLSRIEVQQDGETVFAFAGCVLDGVQNVANGDGSLTVHFYMNGTRVGIVNETDQEYIQAAKIMMGEVE